MAALWVNLPIKLPRNVARITNAAPNVHEESKLFIIDHLQSLSENSE